jgi:hypothetical protein
MGARQRTGTGTQGNLTIVRVWRTALHTENSSAIVLMMSAVVQRTHMYAQRVHKDRADR